MKFHNTCVVITQRSNNDINKENNTQQVHTKYTNKHNNNRTIYDACIIYNVKLDKIFVRSNKKRVRKQKEKHKQTKTNTVDTRPQLAFRVATSIGQANHACAAANIAAANS